MKKILGISLVAVLAVSPMMAMAAVTDAVPVHDNNAVVPNVDPGFALAPASSDTDNNAASAGYVKGAYNAAIKAVNKVNAKVDTKADSSTVTTLSGRVDNLQNAGYITKNVNDLTYYTTTTDMNTALDGKQATLSEAQLAAANSGITSDKVSTYDGYATGKQNTLSATNQLDTAYIATGANAQFVTAAEKSGWDAKQAAITSTAKLGADLVDDTNSTNKFVTAEEKAAWNGKQDALDANGQAAVASGITAEKVADYDAVVAASADYATEDGVVATVNSLTLTQGAVTHSLTGDITKTDGTMTIMTDWSDETNGKRDVTYVANVTKGDLATNVSVAAPSIVAVTYNDGE